MGEAHRYEWHDIAVTALADVEDNVFVRWRIVDILGWLDDGRPIYGEAHDAFDDDAATEPARPDVEPLVEGTVKWDGCCDIDVGGSGPGYQLHYCGWEHGAKNLATALQRMYEMTAWLLGRGGEQYDGLPAPVQHPTQKLPGAPGLTVTAEPAPPALP